MCVCVCVCVTTVLKIKYCQMADLQDDQTCESFLLTFRRQMTFSCQMTLPGLPRGGIDISPNWYRKRLKIETKLRLFKAVVLPTLLYGSETWVPLAPHLKRLQAFIMGCLRVILGVSRWDKMRNTELRSLAGLERVEIMLMRRRLRWLGHVQRMEGCRLPTCV